MVMTALSTGEADCGQMDITDAGTDTAVYVNVSVSVKEVLYLQEQVSVQADVDVGHAGINIFVKIFDIQVMAVGSNYTPQMDISASYLLSGNPLPYIDI